MNYELCKQLKDAGSYLTQRECSDCQAPMLRGHKAIRCAPCQKKHRNNLNVLWQQKYYFANRARILGRHSEYQKFKREFDETFRDAERTKYLKRFRKLIENGGSHTTSQWKELCVRHNHTCLGCGRKEPEIKLTRDHIIPLSKGGNDTIENIQPLCVSCNSSKKDKPWTTH
jgi:5-methylcytosine-specific restriction endonuclease McrA